ncbi:MAG: hypothetical protein EP335_15130 [Alphaproteobacteria bacterium]|nr:MAG: hypothetical protein EP335_15130 [Alphaproteobacteria bacterium]
MGGIAHIAVAGVGGPCAGRAIMAAFDAMDRLAAMTDRNNADSALMQACAAPVGASTPVPDWMWHAMALANDIAYRTDGLFDAVAAGTEGLASWTDLDLSDRGYVRLRGRLFVALDGLIKGYAADIGIKALKEFGMPAGLVDVGGRIAAFGPSEWRVHFRHEGTGACVPVPVRDGAVAALGRFSRAGLLDTRRRVVLSGAEAAGDILVRAPSAAVADALTKVAALRPHRAPELLRPFGARPIVLTADGVHALNYVS